MKLNILLVFNTLVAFVFGLGFILTPAAMGALYGMATSPSTILAAQFYGVSLIGIGLICWMLRNITDRSTQRGIVMAQLMHNVIGIIISVMGTTSGVMNTVGWSAVAIYLVLALGYGYFLLANPS